jgi:LacI family transcriptional regulator
MIAGMTNPQTVTIRDVARLAGVSISTASRALTGAGGVRPALEKSIVEAARKLNYRPNAAARGLRKARTMTLGIVFNNLKGPGQLDLVKGVGAICNGAAYSLMAADANGDHDEYLKLAGRFFEQRVEGLFLVAPTDLGDSLVDYRRACIPVIALLGKDASGGSIPLVAASERHGIRDAVEALFGLGHRNVGYVLRHWDERRLYDVRQALAARGLLPSAASIEIEDWPSDETVEAGVHRMLSQEARPTALIVHSSLLGGTLAAVGKLGLEVPADLSLVALGASSWHQLFMPNLAAVEADLEELGRLACSVMLETISGSEPRQTYSVLARWVPRSTIGPAPA